MFNEQLLSRKGRAHVVPRGDGPNASLHTQDRSLGDLSRLQHGVVDVSYSRKREQHVRSSVRFRGVAVDTPCQDIVTVSLTCLLRTGEVMPHALSLDEMKSEAGDDPVFSLEISVVIIPLGAPCTADLPWIRVFVVRVSFTALDQNQPFQPGLQRSGWT